MKAAEEDCAGIRVERSIVAFLSAAVGAFLSLFAVAALGAFTGVLNVCASAPAWWIQVYWWLLAVVPIASAIALPCATLRCWYPTRVRESQARSSVPASQSGPAFPSAPNR